MMISKRGVIGGFITGFIGTIVIVLILAVFAVVGAIIKTVDSSAGEIEVLNESDVGLGNMMSYKGFVEVLEIKYYLLKGSSLEESIEKGGYYEK